MKNAVIAILVLLLGIVGFLYFTKDNNIDSSNNDSVSGEAEDEATNTSSGKTLDLSSKGLKDISQDILDDKSIVIFDVSGNNLTGALPAEIRKLSNLEVLNASNNNMTGIPAEIGQLSKLKVVNFSNNDISGLPLEIGNLSNLETLDLRGNPNVSRYDISLIQPKIPNSKILTD